MERTDLEKALPPARRFHPPSAQAGTSSSRVDPGGLCAPAAYPVSIQSDGIRCGENGIYRLRVANTLELRLRAWRLAYQIYRLKGFAAFNPQELWCGPHDALPRTITLLAEKSGLPVATLSLVFDSGRKIPADDVFGLEIDRFRARGRRLCEIVSLVSLEEGMKGIELIKYLFKAAYIAAHGLEHASDLLITVNPRHAPFYEHKLLFQRVGTEAVYPKLNNAPAVLMLLNLATAQERYRARYDTQPPARNLYRFFLSKAPEVGSWIRTQRRPLDQDELGRGHSELSRRLRWPPRKLAGMNR